MEFVKDYKGMALSGRLLRMSVMFMSITSVAVAVGFLLDADLLKWYMTAVNALPAVYFGGFCAFFVAGYLNKDRNPKKITVTVKYAMDTMQVLKLKEAGRCDKCGSVFLGCITKYCTKCGNANVSRSSSDDSMIGSDTYMHSTTFMNTVGMGCISALFLIFTIIGPMLYGDPDIFVFSLGMTLFIHAGILAAFYLEYYTCCKRRYKAEEGFAEFSFVDRHRFCKTAIHGSDGRCRCGTYFITGTEYCRECGEKVCGNQYRL